MSYKFYPQKFNIKNQQGQYINLAPLISIETDEQISDINDAAQAIKSNILATIENRMDQLLQNVSNASDTANLVAPYFDSTADYDIGDCVVYNINKLYKFINQHTAGQWNDEDVQEIKIIDLVTNLLQEKAQEAVNSIMVQQTQNLNQNTQEIISNIETTADTIIRSKTASENVSMLAQQFDYTKNYNIGDNVIYTPDNQSNSALYSFTSQHVANTLWNNNQVQQIILSNDISELKKNLVIKKGTPTITWGIGSINNSNGTAFNNPANSIRSSTIIALKDSTISVNNGYVIKVFLYDINTSTYTGTKTDWITTYKFSNDYKARILVSDTEHYNNNEYTLENTSYSEQIIWDEFILNKISDTVEDLKDRLDEIQPKITTGGYIDITKTLTQHGRIGGGSVGDTLTLDIVEEKGFFCGKYSVQAGDTYRITGNCQAGGIYRLWIFTDSNKKVKTRSALFTSETNLILTAPVDGYFIFNANGLSTIKVEKFIKNLEEIQTIINFNHQYNYLNTGHDILSAFSNIMCCGDSLTASVVYTGVSGNNNVTRAAYKRFPQILALRTGAEVETHAIGGYTTVDWWRNYHQYIVQKPNQLAIIYLGTNGGLVDEIGIDNLSTNIEDYDTTKNIGAYCAIVKSFIDVGARVLLIHINKRDSNLFETNMNIDKIAEKFGCAVVTVPFLEDDKYHLWPDGTNKNSLHYNDLGYAAFTESLIRNVGALPTDMMARLIPI